MLVNNLGAWLNNTMAGGIRHIIASKGREMVGRDLTKINLPCPCGKPDGALDLIPPHPFITWRRYD